MITIRQGKELISVESWPEIENRSGFVAKLDTTEHKLRSIIGSYQLEHEIPCGPASCNQLHAKGYIVATVGGVETNIGKPCGKRCFGIDFETQRKQFDRDILEQENRKALWVFRDGQDVVYARIANLRQGGMDAVYKRSRALLGQTKECPYAVVRWVAASIRTGNHTFSTQREATAAEVDAIELLEGKKVDGPHIVEKAVAEIAGLQTLYPENDLKQLVIMELQVKLDEFRKLDIDQLTHEQLKRWVKWTDAVEPILVKARQIVGYGRQLLDAANLKPLGTVLERADEIALFRTYLKTLGNIPAEQIPS
ncbi:MAG: hypothetical protein M3Z31_08475 [Pseudomonadota bacterium]|nr:hypothetical protein [Pseudomonadota bacterium]